MSRFRVDVALARGRFSLRLEMALAGHGVTILLGPSGSGKSTLLRVIAGLERPDSGCILDGDSAWFDAARNIHRPPQQRRVGLVFQEYALFSHLTVAANIGYGVAKAERAAAVRDWLDRLRLSEYADAYPSQLSGGQRQRVALARALATRPDILLLDEPFSALDISLRHHLRGELQRVIEGLEIPVLMVTHDLEEARFLADRVGVLVDGTLLRLGPKAEVFGDPRSRAVAGVLGWQNFLAVDEVSGGCVHGGWGALELHRAVPPDTRWLAIRAEHVHLATSGIAARVERVTDLGASHALECLLTDGTAITVSLPWDHVVPPAGTPVHLDLPGEHLRDLTNANETEHR